MKQLTSLVAWTAAALVAALAALNWSTLMAPALVNLVIYEIQLPLGVVMLGLAGGVAALFFVAYLQQQISSLRETRRLLKEIQRVQDLADKAEASRIEGLQQMVAHEFKQLNGRLGPLLDARAGGATGTV